MAAHSFCCLWNGSLADVISVAVAKDDTALVGDVPALVDNDDAVMTIGASRLFLVAPSGCAVFLALMVVFLFIIFL
jgi:hypothetical protein